MDAKYDRGKLDLRAESGRVSISVAKNDEGRKFVNNLINGFMTDGKWHILQVRIPHDEDRIYITFDMDDIQFLLEKVAIPT